MLAGCPFSALQPRTSDQARPPFSIQEPPIFRCTLPSSRLALSHARTPPCAPPALTPRRLPPPGGSPKRCPITSTAPGGSSGAPNHAAGASVVSHPSRVRKTEDGRPSFRSWVLRCRSRNGRFGQRLQVLKAGVRWCLSFEGVLTEGGSFRPGWLRFRGGSEVFLGLQSLWCRLCVPKLLCKRTQQEVQMHPSIELLFFYYYCLATSQIILV